MTMDDFMKITSKINNGKNLEPEFIKSIYETIEKEPITLDEDEDAKLKIEGASANSFKRKQDLFIKEGIGLAKRGAALIKKK